MALVGIDRDPGPTDLKLSRLPAMGFTTPASLNECATDRPANCHGS